VQAAEFDRVSGAVMSGPIPRFLSFTFLKWRVQPMRQLAPTVVLQVLLALPLAAQFEERSR
jgi:hypothetical protein